MTIHADLHFLISTISAKLVATPLLGLNVFMIFRFLTLILSWKRGKLSKTLSGNFMWICGRSASFFRFNISLNLEQVCDNIAYVSVEFLEEFTASTNIVSILSSISICLSFKPEGSIFSVSCGCSSVELGEGFHHTYFLFRLSQSMASKGKHCIWF